MNISIGVDFRRCVKRQPIAIFLMGPTASGKTSVAIALKKQNLKVDIISVDSALVYRGMNIGTNKPTASDLKIAPHKLIDIRDPVECYSVSDFCYDAINEMEKIRKLNRIPLLVGGSMLYFNILLKGGIINIPSNTQDIRNNLQYKAQKVGWVYMYNMLKDIDPVSANLIHFNDHKRIIRALEIFFSSGKTWTELKITANSTSTLIDQVYQFAIAPVSRVLLNKRIKQRFHRMLDIGFEKEVRTLFNRVELHTGGIHPAISCIGYRQMWKYLSGVTDYDSMVSTSIYATRQLAKKQLTWLRNWTADVCWLNSENLSHAIDVMSKYLKKIY